jgi:arthrofactin-type cyclic lipopeptide synthetase C
VNEARNNAWNAGRDELDASASPSASSLFDRSMIESIGSRVPGGVDNVQDIYELSPTQQGMLFHYQLDHQCDGYVLSTLFELASQAHLNALIGALQFVVTRHDALRTVICWEGLPHPMQVVCRHATLAVAPVDLSPEADALQVLRDRMKPGRHGLDMSKAPLAHLLHARDARSGAWYALLQVHHIICDHQSLQRLIAEALAHVAGHERELTQPVPYRDFIAQVLAGAATPKAQAFFRSALGDLEEPTAAFGLLDTHADGSRIAEVRQRLDETLARRVRELSQRASVTPARLFHAAWALVIARTSARDDVVFGTVLMAASQRKASDAARTLGMCVNTLPLRLCLKGLSAADLVHRIHAQLLALSTHEHTALSVAQGCAALDGTAPVFTAVLNVRRGVAVTSGEGDFAAGVRVLERGEAWTNYPFALTVDDLGEEFLLTMQSDARIDPSRIIGYVRQAVDSIIEALEHRPDTPALTLEVLPPAERHQVTLAFNDTRAAHPVDKRIHDLFEAQAFAAPERVAMICGSRKITYADLNAKANQLAHVLTRRGVRPDATVVLYLERGIDAVIALLATLKAGGAYVPLDCRYPAERLGHVVKDSAPVVIVTEQRLRGALPLSDVPLLVLDQDAQEIAREPGHTAPILEAPLSASHLAYVIYTSGSTGIPKGVQVEHRSVVNLVCWHHAAFGLKAGQRSSSVASLGFDAASWEILTPLTIGATLAMAPEDLTSDVDALLDWWCEQELDVGFLPTPVAEVLLKRPVRARMPGTLLIGGDRLSFQPSASPMAVINNYGPTESTVVATSGRLSADDLALHIGRPIANTQIYILNAQLQPVPIGVPGELYVGGVGVARGYFNRAQMQAQRFIADPFSAEPARLYRTGDLGKWLADGTIQFLGRNDDQVKIRGYRIELGEIEAQLLRQPEVGEVIVVVREDEIGAKRLVAYLVPRANQSLQVEQLRARLQALLPDYMIPSAFKVMASLPVTRHGKIDRRALPAPVADDYASHDYEPPRGEMEKLLADIWRTVLRIERVGRKDHFFELGGNSLLAMQAITRIRAVMPMELSVRLLFAHPTLEALAAELHGLRRAYLLDGIAAGAAGMDDLIDEVASMPEREVHELVRSLARREERL